MRRHRAKTGDTHKVRAKRSTTPRTERRRSSCFFSPSERLEVFDITPLSCSARWVAGCRPGGDTVCVPLRSRMLRTPTLPSIARVGMYTPLNAERGGSGGYLTCGGDGLEIECVGVERRGAGSKDPCVVIAMDIVGRCDG